MHQRTQREQQAEAEVGHTTVRPAVALALTVFFLALIAAPLFWESFQHGTDREPGAFHPLQEAVRLPPNPTAMGESVKAEGLLHGAATLNSATLARMERFETRLQQTSPLRDLVLLPVNQWFSGVLGASNGNVVPGRDGWLFYEPAVRHVTGPPFYPSRFDRDRETDPLAALRHFQEQLAERGVTLMVVPVPGKVSIYPERLAAGIEGTQPRQNSAHDAFLDQLRDAGILVCDPTAALLDARAREEAYLRQDSHWTPSGMAHVAAWLATRIEESVPMPSEGKRVYHLATRQDVTARGDLSYMLYPGSEAGPGDLETVGIEPVIDVDGKAWAPDSGAAVLLLGDSFTNIYSREDLGWGVGAGLAERLSFCLQRPVDRIARNDNGACATRQSLSDDLARGVDRLASTRVVVYQFAARELSWGDWKEDIPLELGKSDATAAEVPDRITVEGKLVRRSLPPAPGSVPYKDCIVSLLLEPTGGQAGFTQNVLVRAWGMRDRQWTEVTGWQIGDRLSVTMKPWAEVRSELDSINRVPLDDEIEDELPVWWLEQNSGFLDSSPPALQTDPGVTDAITEDPGLVQLVRQLDNGGQSVWQGQNGWLFFTPELRSLAAGPFWGEAAPRVSRAANAAFSDPLPAILDFHRQLRDAGIELVFMPVPPKAGIYPDQVAGGEAERDLSNAMAPDAAMGAFLARLQEAGITVIDLPALFNAQADTDREFLYCQSDTHWSPRGLGLAAHAVAEHLRARPWYQALPRTSYDTRQTTLHFTGDLAAMAGGSPPDETVVLTQVGRLEANTLTPVPPDRASPILLIGDSHNLVFHAGGDMHATGGGLPDLLAFELGMPVDLVAVRGSGATTPRINLARRQDKLAGKNVILWCLAAREFTESTTGWRLIPIVP